MVVSNSFEDQLAAWPVEPNHRHKDRHQFPCRDKIIELIRLTERLSLRFHSQPVGQRLILERAQAIPQSLITIPFSFMFIGLTRLLHVEGKFY